MTTLVRDLLFRVSSLLQDVRPQFMRWPERELVVWLNDGQRAIAKYLPWACSRLDGILLLTGSRQSLRSLPAARIIPGDGSPSQVTQGIYLYDVVRNLGANGQTPGPAIRVTTREDLDNFLPNWHANPGTVVEHFTFDPRTPTEFYVIPPVAAGSSVWVEVSYAANPNEIPLPPFVTDITPGNPVYGVSGNSPVVVSLDDRYCDDLVNYIAARATLKDGEFVDSGRAQLYSQLFTSSISAQVQAVSGESPNLSLLPFTPGADGSAK